MSYIANFSTFSSLNKSNNADEDPRAQLQKDSSNHPVTSLTSQRKIPFRNYHFRGENGYPISNEDVKKITKLFSILSGNFPAFHITTIYSLQKELEYIHPLNFLEIIHQNEKLKKYFVKIVKADGLVWGSCLSNFNEALQHQKYYENIRPHLLNFQNQTGLPDRTIELLIYKDEIDRSDVLNILNSSQI